MPTGMNKPGMTMATGITMAHGRRRTRSIGAGNARGRPLALSSSLPLGSWVYSMFSTNIRSDENRSVADSPSFTVPRPVSMSSHFSAAGLTL